MSIKQKLPRTQKCEITKASEPNITQENALKPKSSGGRVAGEKCYIQSRARRTFDFDYTPLRGEKRAEHERE